MIHTGSNSLCEIYFAMKITVSYFIIAVIFISCSDDIVLNNNPENVFRTFWKSMNERYVNFDTNDINWDSVYLAYYPKVQVMQNDTELIPVFKEILDSLKDKHIAIVMNNKKYISYNDIDLLRSVDVVSPTRYKFESIEPYIFKNGFFIYQSVLRNYIYIDLIGFFESFNIELLKSEIKKLNYSKGIIFDVRGNSGGYFEFPLEIISWLYKGEKTLFYQSVKKSPKRNDFSIPKPFEYTGIGLIPDTIPIILLTNPITYSAANSFSYILQEFPNCITVGLPTGGGDGPIHSELLPNGWSLQYPYFRNYSLKGDRFEYKLFPNYYVDYSNVAIYINEIYSYYHDDQFIKALCLLDSINKYPYTDYKKIWN